MTGYFSNIGTLGTLVAVILSAMAFCIRANPPLATLYLTHVPSQFRLLGPRLATMWIAVVAASILGGAAATYETAILLGAPRAGATIAGIALSAAAMVLAVALTFLASAIYRGQLVTVAVTLAVAYVGLPLIGVLPGLSHIGPAAFTSLPVKLQTAPWSTDDTWACMIAAIVAAACVAGGLWRSRRWEL
jgi:ABC-2 type transport system permease protein